MKVTTPERKLRPVRVPLAYQVVNATPLSVRREARSSVSPGFMVFIMASCFAAGAALILFFKP